MIRLVITDLDNTLYDWVGAHVPAFNAMVQQLERSTRQTEADLLASFRRVHRRHRTSEYAFGVLELDVLAEEDTELDASERLIKYADALQAFYTARDEHLRLYDGVVETLERLKAHGTRVVAHTDAMMLYASGRVCQLGLEPLLDGLFATTDHALPPGVSLPDAHLYSDAGRCRSSVPIQGELTELKPDARVLAKILARFETTPRDAVYIGDSLSRDVLLAQRAGVHDVFARYGPSYDSALYQRLVEITHWTPEDVARETELRRHKVEPSFVVDRFAELYGVVRALEGQRPKGGRNSDLGRAAA
jgi:FMN phosphatase YigB (HAD superfamily)